MRIGCLYVHIRLIIDACGIPRHNPASMKYLNIVGYLAIVLAFGSHWFGHDASWEPKVTFILAALGVIPLAHLMGEATEQLAEHTGPTLGGLLNATFGNAAEIIIGVIALSKGLNEIVKASLTGSILGNLLLVSGAAMLAGGWKRERQTFSRSAAEANSGLLALAAGAMLLPAIFHFTAERVHDIKLHEHEEKVSLATSFVLLAVYALGLLFTLRTHKHLFTRPHAESPEDKPGISAIGHAWSVKGSVMVLLAASVGIAVVAELLVGSAEAMAKSLGWSEIFVGVVLLAIIGNAAEHSTAILMALRDDMDTAMTISYQSSIQIALFATPFLVLVSWVFHATGISPAGGHALNLVFSPMEVVAVVLTVGIVIVLCMNGESNWFEGVLLLALYAILGIAFFYIPGGEHSAVESGAMGAAHVP
jgi:Ca2+:H+ antiporter